MGLNTTMGVLINNARKQQDINLSLLARRIGISKSHLSEIENSKKSPSLPLMRKIAKELDDPELLHAYLRKKFPEINKAYQEAALYSEAGRIFKGNVISQMLSEKTMEMLLTTKDAKKLATETLKTIFLTRPYDSALEERLERNLKEFKSIAQDITKNY
jgi:transcriptional regulator with XRE-family HTH domain